MSITGRIVRMKNAALRAWCNARNPEEREQIRCAIVELTKAFTAHQQDMVFLRDLYLDLAAISIRGARLARAYDYVV